MAGSSQPRSPAENILPERLQRTRRKNEPGCALALGIVFTMAAVIAGVILTQVELAGSPWPYYALCAGAGVLGLLLLWSWFVQKMTAHLPPACVELSESPLVVGTRAKICVRQTGPATLKTLRANLVCLRREHKRVRAGGSTRTWVDKQVYDQNLIDARDVRALVGDEWIQQAEFDVPSDQPLSMSAPNERINWRIEVWVRVGMGLGKMHSFDVRVTGQVAEAG